MQFEMGAYIFYLDRAYNHLCTALVSLQYFVVKSGILVTGRFKGCKFGYQFTVIQLPANFLFCAHYGRIADRNFKTLSA